MSAEVGTLDGEEEANLRAQDAMLTWTTRRGSLWVKRMTEDWQTPYPEEVAVHRLLATLDAARVDTAGTLDEAWAAAEEALPPDHFMYSVERDLWALSRGETGWSATAGLHLDPVIEGHGPTPAAALLALAAALRAVPA